MKWTSDPGSFRDSEGYVIRAQGRIFRVVTETGAQSFEQFAQSRLCRKLTDQKLIVGFERCDELGREMGISAHALLEPRRLPFISYPYEWCFTQLKEAALLTLEIQMEALKEGFILKDASAYNVAFLRGHPVHLDTLSVTPYKEGQPWYGYRQFCSHFLAPLLLMAYRDERLRLMLRDFIDGVPLDLASDLLPLGARCRFGVLSHIVLHAASVRGFAGKPGDSAAKVPQVPKINLVGLVENLQSLVSSLKLKGGKSQWSDYEQSDHYTAEGKALKLSQIREWVEGMPVGIGIDLGSNTGEFTQILADSGFEVVACDGDHQVVEILHARKKGVMTSIVMDLTNPSGGIGWGASERTPLSHRVQASVVCALGLVHHLRVSGGVPFARIAEYFAELGERLIIEYVGPSDEKAAFLLRSSSLAPEQFSIEAFMSGFGEYYSEVGRCELPGMDRTLFYFTRRFPVASSP